MCDSGLYSKWVFSVDTIDSIIMMMMEKEKEEGEKKKEKHFFKAGFVCNFRYKKFAYSVSHFE